MDTGDVVTDNSFQHTDAMPFHVVQCLGRCVSVTVKQLTLHLARTARGPLEPSQNHNKQCVSMSYCVVDNVPLGWALKHQHRIRECDAL
eukprot:2237389-Karenia_brevis.AAC.1